MAVITSLCNLLSIRCDDETGGSNNDKERFARYVDTLAEMSVNGVQEH